MLTAHVGIVSEESKISPSELTRVAAALQKQISRDFGPLWKIQANVAAFTSLEDLPLDYWPVVIKDDIGDPSAAGYHEDQHGQPFALVEYSQGWSLTASHEVLEMLADPFGRRQVAGESPVTGQGRVKFLVEVCDPCEADAFSYTVNGIRVSDFYTPNYFDPVKSPGARYSYTGSLASPREVKKGGYLSWYHPKTHTWWQRTYFGSKPADAAIKGLRVTNGNVRAAIDRHTEAGRQDAMAYSKPPKASSRGQASFDSRADDLRKHIAKLGNAK